MPSSIKRIHHLVQTKNRLVQKVNVEDYRLSAGGGCDCTTFCPDTWSFREFEEVMGRLKILSGLSEPRLSNLSVLVKGWDEKDADYTRLIQALREQKVSDSKVVTLLWDLEDLRVTRPEGREANRQDSEHHRGPPHTSAPHAEGWVRERDRDAVKQVSREVRTLEKEYLASSSWCRIEEVQREADIQKALAVRLALCEWGGSAVTRELEIELDTDDKKYYEKAFKEIHRDMTRGGRDPPTALIERLIKEPIVDIAVGGGCLHVDADDIAVERRRHLDLFVEVKQACHSRALLAKDLAKLEMLAAKWTCRGGVRPYVGLTSFWCNCDVCADLDERIRTVARDRKILVFSSPASAYRNLPACAGDV